MEDKWMPLMLKLADRGTMSGNHPDIRKLWYRGRAKWVSPTHMALSDLGAKEVHRHLYANA